MSRHMLAVAVFALAFTPPAALDAQESPRQPPFSERTGVFGARVRESSGVAASRVHSGILWTHNDSGDDPVVYATDLSGANRGSYRLATRPGRDWEDIAIGPCPARDGWCLYIADTGDNLERHGNATVIVIAEPSPVDPGTPSREPLPVLHALHIRYADRARDVEAIVAARDRIELFTKGRTGPIVRYVIPITAFRTDSITVPPTDTMPIIPSFASGRQVTGGSLSPNGTRLVLRTYTELFFYAVEAGGRLVSEGPPWWIGGLREPQGEGVDFLDEDTVVLTSEALGRQPGTIHRVRCPRVGRK